MTCVCLNKLRVFDDNMFNICAERNENGKVKTRRSRRDRFIRFIRRGAQYSRRRSLILYYIFTSDYIGQPLAILRGDLISAPYDCL